jgi:hypothetical protein
MRRLISTLQLCLVGLAGCIHPAPPTEKPISYAALPPLIAESFKKRFPNAEVKRVVEWFFDHRVVCYYINFSDPGFPPRTVAITPKGEVTEYLQEHQR